MREGNKKQKWDKPKLIILVRGKPEEMTLATCKHLIFPYCGGMGADSKYGGCFAIGGVNPDCFESCQKHDCS